MDDPQASPIFTKYPNFMKREYSMNFITDTLRTMTTTSLSPYELEPLLEAEIDKYKAYLTAPAVTLNHMADSFPGLGIVAAVS